jgi:dihydrofolate synthase/folylpolyglutamate synthase
VIGMLANKQGPEILQTLLAPGDRAWIVPVPGHVSWSCDQLASRLQAHPSLAAAMRPALDLDQALEAAAMADPERQDLADPPSVVLAGSLYLIGHLLAAQP